MLQTQSSGKTSLAMLPSETTLLRSTQQATPTTAFFTAQGQENETFFEHLITPTYTNTTDFPIENDFNSERSLLKLQSHHPALPWSIAITSGVFSALFNKAGAVVWQLAQRNHFSPYAFQCLSALLYITHTLLLSALPPILAYVNDPNQKTDPILITMAYCFLTTSALQGIRYFIQTHFKQPLHNHPNYQILVDTVPFLAFSLLFTNPEQTIIENLGLFGASYGSALVTQVALDGLSQHLFNHHLAKIADQEQHIELVTHQDLSSTSSCSSDVSSLEELRLSSRLTDYFNQNELNRLWKNLVFYATHIPDKNGLKKEIFSALHFIHNTLQDIKMLYDLENNLIQNSYRIEEKIWNTIIVNVSKISKNEPLKEQLLSTLAQFSRQIIEVRTAILKKNNAPTYSKIMNRHFFLIPTYPSNDQLAEQSTQFHPRKLFSLPTSIHSIDSAGFRKNIQDQDERNAQSHYDSPPTKIACVTPENCYCKM